MAYARESGRLIRLSKYIAHAHPKACDIGSMRGSSSAFAIVSIQQLATNTKCSDRFAHDLLLCTEERPGTYSMRPAELLNQLAKAYKFKAGLILSLIHSPSPSCVSFSKASSCLSCSWHKGSSGYSIKKQLRSHHRPSKSLATCPKLCEPSWSGSGHSPWPACPSSGSSRLCKHIV